MKQRIALLVALCGVLTASIPSFADTWQQRYDNATQSLLMESYAAAQGLFEQMLKNRDDNPAHEVLARAGLAEALLWQGQFDQSSKQFKTVLKNIKTLGDSAEAASIYDSYAWLLQAQGRNSDAFAYAKQALDLRKQLLAPTAEETAQSLEHLGELSEAQGMLKDAAGLYEQALVIRKQGGEQQSIQLANLTEKLAIVQLHLGNRDRATQLFAESLAEKQEIKAVFQPFVPHPAYQTVMYRYTLGAPNCSRAAVDGESLATITSADNVTVQVSVAPSADFKGTTAFVRVTNNGHKPIDFLPKPPILLETKPEVKLVKVLSSDQLAQQIEKKGERKASLIRFFQGDATTPVTSNIMTTGGYAPGYGPGYGYVRPGYGWGGYYPAGPQMTTVTTYVPDYEARARAEAKAQAAVQKATATATDIREQKLIATTLNPGQSIQGTVQFDAKNIKDGIFRVAVGNAIFEFPLSQN